MDLNKVAEFVQFSRSMNFTMAAHELHLSQSALSKHIREIENELEVLLVERATVGKRNTLTPTGHRFLAMAEDLLAQYDGIVKECRRVYSEVPPARIQDMRDVFNIISQLRHRLSEAGLGNGNFAYTSVKGPIAQALDDNVVDFATIVECTPKPHAFLAPELAERYGSVALKPEELCLLVSKHSPLAALEETPAALLASHPVVTIEESLYTNWMQAVRSIFADRGIALTFKVVRDSPHSGGAFPLAAEDVVICTQHFSRYYRQIDVEDVVEVSLGAEAPVVYPFLVYRRDTTSQAVRQVIEACAEPLE